MAAIDAAGACRTVCRTGGAGTGVRGGQRAGRCSIVARVLTGESAPAEVQAVYTFGYDEVLADSKLVDIIYSIERARERERDHRQSLARGLSHHSHTLQEYWWFIQIITPITRLPQELLYEILLITIDIDDMSHSPSALMRVCKPWYSLVTGLGITQAGDNNPKGCRHKQVGKVFGCIS